MDGIRNMLDLSTAHMPYNPDEQERYVVERDPLRGLVMPSIYDRVTRENSERWLDVKACLRHRTKLNRKERFWGSLRVAKHEHGWIVFVPGREHAETVPEWAQPLIKYALEHDCIVVNFDRDADAVDRLPKWEW